MNIKSARYLISSPDHKKAPRPDRPEYAFIGRSNVGKSSLINLICDNQKLAKTSGSPGKTQMINHFEIEATSGLKGHPHTKWYLVDLPGYGFAKVSQSERKKWQKMIRDYIRHRENLVSLFVLIDARHKPQEADLDFINQLGEWEVPFVLVFTKSDKITQKETAAHVKKFLQTMLKKWEDLPPHFVTSAVKKSGRKQILEFIDEANKQFMISAKTKK